MKNVTFKEVRIKNFLSIGNEKVVVRFNKGLSIITGVNKDKEDRRNGVGKSSIADAIYFAIFGTTLRELKKEFILNNITQDTCVVRLLFNVNSPRGNDDFEIIRQLKPSRITIIKNGVDKTRDSIENNNQYIRDVLSASEEIFQNCVILTMNNTVPFMAKGKIDKRKFIEQIFNLQVFSLMMSKLRDEQSEINKNYSIELAKNAEVVKTIATYEAQKVSQIKEREAKIFQINAKITSVQVNIDCLKKERDAHEVIDIESKEAKLIEYNTLYESIDKKLTELTSKISEAQNNVKHKKSHIKQIGTTEHVCPTCVRSIEVSDRTFFEAKKLEIQNEIIEVEEIIRTLTANKATYDGVKIECRKKIVNQTNEIHTLKLKIEHIKALDQRIIDQESIKAQLNDGLLHLKEVSSFDEYIKEAKTRLEASDNEIANIKKTIKLLDTARFVVGEEGVKSYVLTRILQNFNARLAFYLKKLDGNSVVTFDEYFEPVITNVKGKECCYENFSGAEKKAIDLACLFTFIDMRRTQNEAAYNILMLDEICDTSLDAKSISILMELLQEACEKFAGCVFIISHRAEVSKFCTGEVVQLEKVNGLTKRIS